MKNVLDALKNATLNKIDTVTALAAIAKREAGVGINTADIIAINSEKSPLVKLTQVTDVKLAAKNKARNIVKMAHTVCILPENADFYASSIANTAAQIQGNNADNIAAYEPRESKYNHNPNAYAACTLKSNEAKHYLYTIQDRCTKSIYIDVDTKESMTIVAVAALSTPSEAEKLMGLKDSGEKHNKSFDIEHDVVVRTIKQENIVKMEEVKI